MRIAYIDSSFLLSLVFEDMNYENSVEIWNSQDHLLYSINRKSIDREISLEIRNNDKLKRARSRDSIHLATAYILNKFCDSGLLVCSYDKQMLNVAESLGMTIPQGS